MRYDSRLRRLGDAATSAGPIWYAEAESYLREAGRRLEVIGVTDPEAARVAGIVFRLASRVRGERGQVTVRW